MAALSKYEDDKLNQILRNQNTIMTGIIMLIAGNSYPETNIATMQKLVSRIEQTEKFIGDT